MVEHTVKCSNIINNNNNNHSKIITNNRIEQKYMYIQ